MQGGTHCKCKPDTDRREASSDPLRAHQTRTGPNSFLSQAISTVCPAPQCRRSPGWFASVTTSHEPSAGRHALERYTRALHRIALSVRCRLHVGALQFRTLFFDGHGNPYDAFRGRRQLIGWTMDIGHRPTARRKDANIIDVAGHTTLKEQRQSPTAPSSCSHTSMHAILPARADRSTT